ncbi:MAG: CPXCG motif-containing cysteine-rich protein [Thiohalocapsa sp.]|jgi:hypothetical protein
MELLHISAQHCPWCGESIELTVDCSYGGYEAVEDCPVCCAPMIVTVEIAAGSIESPLVTVQREND